MSTQNFGLEAFQSEGRISDNNYKFSGRDRETIDAILWMLTTHDHRDTSLVTVLAGATQYASLTVATTGGTIPAGVVFYYKISYVDEFGNETESTPAVGVGTGVALAPPPVMVLSNATTGGTLDPGIYKYALSYYQSGIGETKATNIATINVPTGTSTNEITVTLDSLPSGATGWKIYRKGPGDSEYFLQDTVTSGPYVDDGTDPNQDCTKFRPTSNTTNSTNKITIDIDVEDLPLDSRVSSWKIYRTSSVGFFGPSTLLTTVVETTTEGGTDLVTTYVDTGASTFNGSPLSLSVVPPPVPQLDVSDIFTGDTRLPQKHAPQGIHPHTTFLPGTLAVQDYNQFYVPADMPAERIDLYYAGANPTGLGPSDYLTLRISDDATQNAIQSLYTDSVTQDEIQQVYNNATGGTFTLTDGTDTTSALIYNILAVDLETELESDITAITDVNVTGNGTSFEPWIITWIDPGGADVTYTLSADDGNLTGGTSTVVVNQNGSDGGTFTLSDGTDTTSAIAFDAVAATIETRLETDITSITAVTVTGDGTLAVPWLIEYINPGSQEVDLLLVDGSNLNGIGYITHSTQGYAVTQVECIVNANQAYHFWQSSTTDAGEIEAEDASGDGANISDALATNDVAVELTTNTDTRYWRLGTGLDEGDYKIIFYVSVDVGDTYVMRVRDWATSVASEGTLTMDTQPTDGDTYTIDTKVYTFEDSLTDVDGNVNVGGTLAQAKLNLVSAMDLSGVAGTDYATSMTAHTTVDVAAFISDDAILTAKVEGVDGDSIATTETFTAGSNIFDDPNLGVTTAGVDGTTISTQTVSDGTQYLPVHTINFSDTGGTEDWWFEVEKTAGSGSVRVDKFEYELRNPLLHAGATATVEILSTGSPSTNGDDAQVTLWF